MMLPYLKDAEEHLGFKYKNVIADAGYKSGENYLFLEGNGQLAFIKPANYEISRTKKYKLTSVEWKTWYIIKQAITMYAEIIKN